MNPGDVWTPEHELQRADPPPAWENRIAEIEAMSREKSAEVVACRAAEPAAPADSPYQV